MESKTPSIIRSPRRTNPAVWGQGFATEAARCVRDYARDVLRLPYAISAILPQNARSRRVAERSGARAAGQMDVTGLVGVPAIGIDLSFRSRFPRARRRRTFPGNRASPTR